MIADCYLERNTAMLFYNIKLNGRKQSKKYIK